jgi:hypothetical protein
MRKKELDGLRDMLKEMESNDSLTETHKKMKFTIRTRVANRVDDGLKEAGCTGA